MLHKDRVIVGKDPAGSLTIVGTGIKGVSHLTLGAKAAIESSDILLFCVADPVTEAKLRELNPCHDNLYRFYSSDILRRDTYAGMTDRIVECVRAGAVVCTAFYGHPGFFVTSTHAAKGILEAEGYDVTMEPGISAIDCLIADLGFDPALTGMQTYEATDYLLRKRKIDTSVPLVLWQVGLVGERGYDAAGFRSYNLDVLCDNLCSLYAPNHDVIIYEAAVFVHHKPSIQCINLTELKPHHLSGISTMFVPPRDIAPVDIELWKKFRRREVFQTKASSASV